MKRFASGSVKKISVDRQVLEANELEDTNYPPLRMEIGDRVGEYYLLKMQGASLLKYDPEAEEGQPKVWLETTGEVLAE